MMRFCCARFAEALGHGISIEFRYEPCEDKDADECYGPWAYMRGLGGSAPIQYCPWCGRPTYAGLTEEDADSTWDWNPGDFREAPSDYDGPEDGDDDGSEIEDRSVGRTSPETLAADLDDLAAEYKRNMMRRAE